MKKKIKVLFLDIDGTLTDGQIYIGDSWNCFEGTINQENNLKLAKRYWSSKKNQLGKEPIIEVLVNGKIKVIEIVKEVNQKN